MTWGEILAVLAFFAALALVVTACAATMAAAWGQPFRCRGCRGWLCVGQRGGRYACRHCGQDHGAYVTD